MFNRALALPPAGQESFFLWGPRQTGKTTLLRRTYTEGLWVDLLRSDEFRRYSARPETLRERLESAHARGSGPPAKRQVVIDEVQRVPELLNQVHWLIENRGVCFALCGSSARKVRRGSANLLGGRAFRFELFGLTAQELGSEFDLGRALNHGYLPRIYQAADPNRMLDAYVGDYLKEEVAAEGLVRSLPTFSDFMDVAALSDGETVNFSNVARECGVSSHTAKNYFQILDDTLLGRWIPAFRKRPKRRTVHAPRFYFADVGVVNRLSSRGRLLPGSEAWGRAFENWVCHELSAYLSYSGSREQLSYWRLTTGAEVDFIVGDMTLAVEVKSAEHVVSHHLKGLRALREEHPDLGGGIVVSREPRSRTLNDGIEVLSVPDFVTRLWAGDLTG